MAQNWIAVDLDGRVILHGGGTLAEWFWSDPGPVLDNLRIPSISKIDSLLDGRFADQTSSPLLRLPPELIDHVLVEISVSSGAYDTRLFLLALTCKAALSVARRHVIRLLKQRHAPLAGHRLICIGDHATTLEDYSPSLLTESEVQTLSQASPPRNSKGVVGQACLYDHATAQWCRYAFRKSHTIGCAGKGMLDLVYRPSAVSRMSAGDFSRFQALVTPCYPMASEPGSPWVLCNLSKNEYVRAEGVQDVVEGSSAFEYRVEGPTLWHLLLACICWSSSPVAGMGYEVEGLWNGRWAGDRFSITALSEMVQRDGEDDWKDVTQEVVQLTRVLNSKRAVPVDV